MHFFGSLDDLIFADGHGVEKSNYLTKELSLQVKKVIVDTAKEWPTYFCRLFPIAVCLQFLLGLKIVAFCN